MHHNRRHGPGQAASAKIWNAANQQNQELIFRPTCHLTACWMHGYRLYLPLSDENMKKDSETQMEILMRSLSEVQQKYSKLPLGLWTQADNCFRESKNQYVFSLNLMLVCIGCFKWAVMAFLRTAHSTKMWTSALGKWQGCLQPESLMNRAI